MYVFDISTSKSGPRQPFFNTFHLGMGCFFNILTSKSALILRGVLCILTSHCASHRTAVHFFNISMSKMLRAFYALCMLTSKCASRHTGVGFSASASPKVACSCHYAAQFFISHLVRWLCTCGFSEPPLALPASAVPSSHIVGSLTSRLLSIIFSIGI